MERHQLNEIYRKLDKKAREIGKQLQCPVGYYNGHYRKNESGDYEMDYYPIPEVTVKGLCDIEIGLDRISVTTKLTRDNALLYEYDRIKTCSFEVYGVEDYLNDFYTDGSTIDGMIESIKRSDEEHIGFCFSFPFETDSKAVCEFVAFLQKDGFFY